MSNLSDEVLAFIKENLSLYVVKEEYFVFYRGTRLFFDFYLPEFSLLVEVQGEQHDKFVEHFHTDRAGFLAYKKRDRLKKEWAHSEGLLVLELRKRDLKGMTTEKFFTLAGLCHE